MKKLVLAPAIALVAGTLAFGTPAQAFPACSGDQLSVVADRQCTITLKSSDFTTGTGKPLTITGLPEGAKVLGVKVTNTKNPDMTMETYHVKQEGSTVKLDLASAGSSTTPEDFSGTYKVVVKLLDNSTIDAGTIEYTDLDRHVTGKPELTIVKKSYYDDFAALGQSIKYTNLEVNANYSWTLIGKNGLTGKGEFTSEGIAKVGGWITVKVTDVEKVKPQSKLMGDYTVTIMDANGKTVATTTFNVGDPKNIPGDPSGDTKPSNTPSDKPGDKHADANYGLTLNPKELTPATFTDKTKGVSIVVMGLKPNEKFQYSVSKETGKDIDSLFNNVQADSLGTWAYTVFGTTGSDELDGFLGKYKVTVKSSKGVLTDTFVVTNTPGKHDDPKAGGSESKDNGKKDMKKPEATGKQLPRTGTELTALVAGGVLLTVGAATVIVTRRRHSK